MRLKRNSLIGVLAFALALSLNGQTPSPATTVLFQNVRVFDGENAALSPPAHVLVRGKRIERISAQPIPRDRHADTVLMMGAPVQKLELVGGKTYHGSAADKFVETRLLTLRLSIPSSTSHNGDH